MVSAQIIVVTTAHLTTRVRLNNSTNISKSPTKTGLQQLEAFIV